MTNFICAHNDEIFQNDLYFATSSKKHFTIENKNAIFLCVNSQLKKCLVFIILQSLNRSNAYFEEFYIFLWHLRVACTYYWGKELLDDFLCGKSFTDICNVPRIQTNNIRMNFNGSDCEIWNTKFNQEFNNSSH